MKIPPVPVKPRTIITPERFADLYRELPDARSRLLVETCIESACAGGS